MTKLPFLLSTALALGGCASPGYDYELRVAPSADVGVAQQAAWGWEDATRRAGQPELEFRVVATPYGCRDSYCIYLEEVPPGDTNFTSADPTTSCGALGCTLTMQDSQTSHTKISNSLDSHPEEQLAAYAHELGHALGLHYEGGAVLMNCPHLDRGIEGPTPEDVTQFYDVRGVGRPGFSR